VVLPLRFEVILLVPGGNDQVLVIPTAVEDEAELASLWSSARTEGVPAWLYGKPKPGGLCAVEIDGQFIFPTGPARVGARTAELEDARELMRYLSYAVDDHAASSMRAAAGAVDDGTPFLQSLREMAGSAPWRPDEEPLDHIDRAAGIVATARAELTDRRWAGGNAGMARGIEEVRPYVEAAIKHIPAPPVMESFGDDQLRAAQFLLEQVAVDLRNIRSLGDRGSSDAVRAELRAWEEPVSVCAEWAKRALRQRLGYNARIFEFDPPQTPAGSVSAADEPYLEHRDSPELAAIERALIATSRVLIRLPRSPELVPAVLLARQLAQSQATLAELVHELPNVGAIRDVRDFNLLTATTTLDDLCADLRRLRELAEICGDGRVADEYAELHTIADEQRRLSRATLLDRSPDTYYTEYQQAVDDERLGGSLGISDYVFLGLFVALIICAHVLDW
jgi:hypothetical protein